MYSLVLHYINPADWYARTQSFQILNIIAELTRAGSWILKNEPQMVNDCYARALELIDLTRSDPRWQTVLQELSRAREYLAYLYHQSEKDKHQNDLMVQGLMWLNREGGRRQE